MSRYLKSCEFELLNFLERNPNNSLDAAGRAKYYQTVGLPVRDRTRHPWRWCRGGARRRHDCATDEELGRWKDLVCGDGGFRQRWLRDLMARRHRRVSPEMRLGR